MSLLLCHPLWAQWNPHTSEAYRQLFCLNWQEAEKQLLEAQKLSQEPENQYIILYLENFLEAIRTMQSGKPETLKNFEKNKQQRLQTIEKNKHKSAYFLYAQAEIHLQSAFVFLLSNQQYDAAQSLKRAYKLLEQNELAFPNFLPTQKSLSVIRILLDFVPRKHHWLLSLLGLKGDSQKGIRDLLAVAYSQEFCALEAQIAYALLQVYVLQNPTEAYEYLKKSTGELGYKYRLVYFVRALLAFKTGSIDLAINELNKISISENGIYLSFAHYLRGEAELLRGNYAHSIQAYNEFLATYQGVNYVKDTFYKIFLNYWFSDDSKAFTYLYLIPQRGATVTAPDRYAQAFAQYPQLPDKNLTKIRLLSDGFQYDKALKMIQLWQEKDFMNEKDKVEFWYRRARIEHGLRNYTQALDYYQLTIRKAGKMPYYFAPNACLQMAIIYETELKDLPKAQLYYEQVLQYETHEYKESLDTKAETALKKLAQSQRKK